MADDVAGPTDSEDLAALARGILDAQHYLVLGTADASGRPWVTPVYFAVSPSYADLVWVSSPTARHSRNIAERAEVSLVVFDSGTPPGEGQGVYMTGIAEELAGDALEPFLALYSERTQAHGLRAWTAAMTLPPAAYRLYRARVTEHFVRDPSASPDARVAVVLTGTATRR